MNLMLKSALDYNLGLLARMFNQSFVNYQLDIQINAFFLAQMVRQEAIDLAASQVVQQDETVIGIAFIGRRGWTSRLAAMGIRPAWRGQGFGRRVMDHLIDQARARGERAMVLEVIEQNGPGMRLYRSCGFREQQRLVGYTAQHPKGLADRQLEVVDLSEVARQIITYGPPDLPWQISGESLAQAGPPNRGYRLGPAYAAISDPAQAPISLRGLVVPAKAQPQVWRLRLLQAMIAAHPTQPWRVPPLYPEALTQGLFESLGFEREPMTQRHMKLELAPQTED